MASNALLARIRFFHGLSVTDLGLFLEAWYIMAYWCLKKKWGRLPAALFESTVVDTAASLISHHKSSVGRNADSEPAVVTAVLRSERYHLAGSNCLIRALTLRSMLNRRGLATDINLGVKCVERGQLSGHAWVTRQGRIVGDREPIVESYSKLQTSIQRGAESDRLA